MKLSVDFPSWDPNQGNEKGDIVEWHGVLYFADADTAVGANPEAGGNWKITDIARLLTTFQKALITV